MTGAREVNLDQCIKCSICTMFCPVAAVNPRFAGPKQCGPDMMRFTLEDPAAVYPGVHYCSNCKNCDLACPSGVRISVINQLAKARSGTAGRPGITGYLPARPDLAGKMASLWPGLVNRVLRWPLGRRLLEKSTGLASRAPLPPYAPLIFRKLLRRVKQNAAGKKVVYFPGCFVEYYRPATGLALVRILKENGYQVVVPGMHCCGLPLFSNGYLNKARRLAAANVQSLAEYALAGMSILTTCPSCYLSLKVEYGELLDVPGSEVVAEKVTDAVAFLANLAANGELAGNFQPVELKIGYHQPCHHKAAGIGIPALRLLKHIPALAVQDLAAGCCGMSGSYGLKRDRYPLAMAVGRELFRAVGETEVQMVVTECGMCGVQINHGTGVMVAHPVEIMAPMGWYGPATQN
ncbi:glycerol-3-phosphate dehydrogenase, anaerobic, C subunit [Desulfofundulus kuznetsovii DSM 6115]|uniref:Glycerol-3-phosphate dehydrogenase, anaerobic, C subunit n=1 Tax=Desulfofundulus kuznetsovii (strain DSM 6115 / VKM B-1805 / 17) TaxID=760568 RepID=A0AAU8PFB9_DESK7|nr:glycerol-3-phosphate dehydrogenase, anaerobic, C subunit [Desulfofundulus kuznetsovii DSM 6115]